MHHAGICSGEHTRKCYRQGVNTLHFLMKQNILTSFATVADVDCVIGALICMDRIHASTKEEITIWIKCRLDGKILLSFLNKKQMEEG